MNPYDIKWHHLCFDHGTFPHTIPTLRAGLNLERGQGPTTLIPTISPVRCAGLFTKTMEVMSDDSKEKNSLD